jgi:methionyl-tRNA formyltransferase
MSVTDSGRPRVLFLGMRNELSRATFESLSDTGVNIAGALIPANGPSVQESGQPIVQLYPEETSSQLPVLTPFLQRDLLHAAWERIIPVFQVRQIADRAVLDTLRLLRPDVACVSCFPNRIPGRLLSFPRFGFLNLHPSLLPDYRGPAPLFWIFRNGDQGSMGITVHRMDEAFDSGDILLQESISLADGISGWEADRLCGERGGLLLSRVLDSLVSGGLAPRPQGAKGSYFNYPSTDDFELQIDWTARRAFNFMRGTAEWGQPYPLESGGCRLALTHADSYMPRETLTRPVVREKNILLIQFSQGVLVARAEEEKP